MADLTVSFTKPAITTRYLITTNIETDVETLKSDVSTLQTETATNTNDISTLSSTVSSQGTTLTSLSSQVQTNTSDISSLKTFENGINTTIDNRVKTDLTTTYSNSDYESMTGLKTWVESKGGNSLTMDEIKENLTYYGNIKNFKIVRNSTNQYEGQKSFDTRTNKLDLNNYYTTSSALAFRRYVICFYKNNNNKICGLCLIDAVAIRSGTGIEDNAGNLMNMYEAFDFTYTDAATSTLQILNDSNEEITKISLYHNANKWNYMNVFFDEKYSDTIIKAFFGDNVSVSDIHCTNVNDYLRTTNYSYLDSTSEHPTYNNINDQFLMNQTKSFLTTYFTSSDFESMTNLKAWIQSLINNQN